jgi:shikimate dehydrogenase
MISAKTRICALIGNPVEHSFSPLIHNAAFRSKKINFRYISFKIENLKPAIPVLKSIGLKGFSITIPHKVEIMKYLDKLDKTAKEIGAVNTVVSRNKKLIGYNTDCEGAINALKKKTRIKGKNVVIIGAGGAARAIGYGIKKECGEIIVINRTLSKAKALARSFNCKAGQLSDIDKLDYDILINTTSVGMWPKVNECPVSTKNIKNKVVMDIIFNPVKTKLLREVEKNNCKIISGIEMFLNQAALQFEIWTGKKAPINVMRKVVLSHIK